MLQEKSTDAVRINARKTDVFDIFKFKHYQGPNPYLEVGALVFNFVLTEYRKPLPIEDLVSIISDRYPTLANQEYESYAHLFAKTLSEVGKLEMGLHLTRWNVQPNSNSVYIAIQSLHERTTRGVVYFVWDWFEAINRDADFLFEDELARLQNRFRQSVYGGPTVYALLRTAYEKAIPTFYLWEEGLTQYGYGKKHIRGIATTFDCDSHIDSDFTTRKDDCKAFLKTLGFPVPEGDIVTTEKDALAVAREIGYPVAVKPVVGHKGIGVTAEVQDSEELESAYSRALAAIPEEQSTRIIVEKSISGADFRLLCVNGKFVAATERRPASVVGDGYSTIDELIREENRKPARWDTPTSPMSKIQRDEAMELYLREQRLTLDSVLEKDRTVYLRKVANLSAGGMSINATHTVHHDNIILAQDIAQHFRLTCLGIDVITKSLSESWKDGNFAILEINAAPGILMHLNPAVGDSVDVPSHILGTFFESGAEARIPIITFNKISVQELQETIDHILLQHPDWTVGAVCRDGLFVNRSRKILSKNYNSNLQSLLRNPKLDLLIAEYGDEILEEDGMFYQGSNIVVLDNPNETEMMLARDVLEGSTVVIRKGDNISISRKGLIEDYSLGEDEPFTRVYLKEVGTIL
ncbi:MULTISPECIES: ATP-binding protein [unclassified Tolypothrix]|uniref:ATP-binding protein n=1 Tax=unclassified Tolypothrix TaxID=2649714 RepID=UPI0005EAA571|nr:MULTISPECIES: acetate--CoA ligase family protein [unclassified Tolypothrix]BAY89898.1 RimK domain-containing protein ATP-grasp [Microchaete diplosiphon NIES-3275]EKE96930.1 putative cyanophycin synthetase [Tolypothrix sp. PCC 7601]MBE9082160.1 acetate--CoA ligase family protein [Tolypothrix sp. LEGE 11397]UYD24135.1 acetate--CoA ligase family protein [Tolypothrix sp. PCC 7712]UYD33633.1 acetate--CoA ligase family protein [Tolypothrix sp. PCC 7601]